MRRCARLADAGKAELSQLSALIGGFKERENRDKDFASIGTLPRTIMLMSDPFVSLTVMRSLGTTGLANSMCSASFGNGIVPANPAQCLLRFQRPLSPQISTSQVGLGKACDLLQHINSRTPDMAVAQPFLPQP